MTKPVKKKINNKKALKIIIAVVAVVALLGGGVLYYVTSLMGGLDRQLLSQEKLNIYDDPNDIMWKYHNDVVNFAVFGIDARDLSEQTRSDVMMIVSLNYSNNTIKMISLQRDLYTTFRGSSTKLSHAYAFGGPELAVSAINSNFKLNIEDYVTVNFYGVAEFIDYLGGVELTITQEERDALNECVEEQSHYGMDGTYLTEYGENVHLNGSQAVGFARVRSVDSDFKRQERQQKVVAAMLGSLKKMNISNIDAVMKSALAACSTSLTNSEIVVLGSWLLKNMNEVTFQTATAPGSIGSYGYDTIDGLSYVVADLDALSKQIKNFIYDQPIDDNVPVPIVKDQTTKDTTTGG